MRFVFFLLVIGFASQPAGAERACTQIGCVDGLTLTIDPVHRWEKGDYIFDFMIEGKAVQCKAALPLKPCEEPSVSCDPPGIVMISESGCALPEDAQGFGDIRIESAPMAIRLDIFHNGEKIHGLAAHPQYQTSQPNGPQCGPVCRSASVDLF